MTTVGDDLVRRAGAMKFHQRIDFSTLDTDEVELMRLFLDSSAVASSGYRARVGGRFLGRDEVVFEGVLPSQGLKHNFDEFERIAREAATNGDSTARAALPVFDEIRRHANDMDVQSLLNTYQRAGAPKAQKYSDWARIMNNHDGDIPWQLRAFPEGKSGLMDHNAWMRLNKLGLEDYALKSQMNVIAAERAFRASIPFIDDAKLRSQFQHWMHNFIPFHFAEEQFVKRWVRTINQSPEAIRKIQLMYGGMKSTGMVTQDPDTGDDIFVMPGSAAFTGVVSKVASMLTGNDTKLPIAMPLTGKVKYTVPGLDIVDRMGIPSFGPVGAIPMGMLADRFPSVGPLQAARTAMSGEQGQGRPIYEQIVPASVRRIAEATLFWDPDKRIHTHHMTRAIAYFDMIGETPEDNASELEKQDYISRISNWAHNLAITEAVYGFIAPAAPKAGSVITGNNPFDVKSLLGLSVDDLNEIPRPRFIELLQSGLEWDEAIVTFLEEAPENLDYTAWTTSQTENTSGRQLPSDNASYVWMLSLIHI
jgi:hypothetical protein